MERKTWHVELEPWNLALETLHTAPAPPRFLIQHSEFFILHPLPSRRRCTKSCRRYAKSRRRYNADGIRRPGNRFSISEPDWLPAYHSLNSRARFPTERDSLSISLLEVIGMKKFAPGIAGTPALIGAVMLLTICCMHRAYAQWPAATVFNNTGCTITVEFQDVNGILTPAIVLLPGTSQPAGPPPGWTAVKNFRFSLPGQVPVWVGTWNPATGPCGACINAGCCCVQECGTPAVCRVDFNTCALC